ncbi:MAG: hypothetical protein INF46_05035 [Rhodobacter sp.]|nr:hypothetical protein [Rhodobacter sp.]MCA3521068.1 hypothetical protein [Rhodobacter sp.]MCA3522968.1 hypothetical protein [Rhodobacter sp.]MCA3525379.1 hypothetical protein [Rhodobacter sp.]MCA3528444.1 hypothetical protein [Rhodobacter sp.]
MITLGSPSLAATGGPFVLRSCLDTASLVFLPSAGVSDPPSKKRQDEIINDFWCQGEFLNLAAGPGAVSEPENPQSAVSRLATHAEACFPDDAGCTRRQELLPFGLSASKAFKQSCASDFEEELMPRRLAHQQPATFAAAPENLAWAKGFELEAGR